jgi:2-haloacid dehalogenase
MLTIRGLLIQTEQVAESGPSGSLWEKSQLIELTRIWHRLPPWPDTCEGLTLLNKHFSTVTLSNTYREMMEDIVSHSNIPFTDILTADMFDSYKPNRKVYLGAAEKMGVKPEECALVAAHLGDLKGAKACGFRAFYVERPLEEKQPELRGENIPDLIIPEDQGGFVTLAKQLSRKAT